MQLRRSAPKQPPKPETKKLFMRGGPLNDEPGPKLRVAFRGIFTAVTRFRSVALAPSRLDGATALRYREAGACR